MYRASKRFLYAAGRSETCLRTYVYSTCLRHYTIHAPPHTCAARPEHRRPRSASTYGYLKIAPLRGQTAWKVKPRRINGFLRSFLLKEKNQKFKAYTPAAANTGVPLKSRKNSPSAQTPRFLHAPHPYLLYAASVRPGQWAIDN